MKLIEKLSTDIDPNTHTAAKCNYCAHRIDVGLEPACVNVCPEHAIISGDMEDETTEIAQLLARQAVKVRKPEKGTIPNLFYIDADESSLNPSATARTGEYLWSQQSTGVGHFAKEAEKLAFSNGDVITSLLEAEKQYSSAAEIAKKELAQDAERLSKSRDKLEEGFKKLEEVYVNGSVENRMPHVANISFKHVEGEGLMMTFNQNIAVYSGSACTSASLEPSYVLIALGLGDDLAHSSIRFSLGRFTTEEETVLLLETSIQETSDDQFEIEEELGVGVIRLETPENAYIDFEAIEISYGIDAICLDSPSSIHLRMYLK